MPPCAGAGLFDGSEELKLLSTRYSDRVRNSFVIDCRTDFGKVERVFGIASGG